MARKNNNMDCAIFQFSGDSYSRNEVIGFSREQCEKLTNLDENNVTKFDISSNPSKGLENLLNNDTLDTTCSHFRVFI